jgi:hypothetical protein
MKCIKLFIIISLFVSSFAAASVKGKILTTAEKSNFESTSRYVEVMDFFKQLKKISPNIKIESIGKSTEGRDVPLVIMGKPLVKSIKDLKKDKRIVIYIQANIHAGEVEGKEAIQMFARDILFKETPDYLKNVLLLICPIFNSDGNEQISKQNRTNQNGPVNGVGVRHNGQMLDLNRDAMKVETPEVYGMITNVLKKYDPAILLDLHTTNGSYHTEPLTYTWMMNGNTDRILINYMRDKMGPWLKKTITEKYSTPNVFYGEFRDMRDPSKGWDSYAFEPRYIVNYIGLRNRLSLLNENYVYADFKTRVLGCYSFLKGVLDYASANKDEIKKILKDSDERVIARGMNPAEKDSFAVEFIEKPTPTPEVINAYEMESYKDANGRDRLKPSSRVKQVTVPYLADYFPKRSVPFPYAYILTIPDAKVVNLLKTHGIKIEKLEKTVSLDVQTIKIKELKPAARLNQGHYNNSIKVEYVKEKKDIPAGSLIVRTAQPLANLAAYLLEPETDDGLLLWNYWDKYLVPQWGGAFLPYPVVKVLTVQDIPSKELK